VKSNSRSCFFFNQEFSVASGSADKLAKTGLNGWNWMRKKLGFDESGSSEKMSESTNSIPPKIMRWEASHNNWRKLIPSFGLLEPGSGRLNYLTLACAIETDWFLGWILESEFFGTPPLQLMARLPLVPSSEPKLVGQVVADIKYANPKNPKLFVGHGQLRRLVDAGAKGDLLHRSRTFQNNCRLLLHTHFWQALCSTVREGISLRTKMAESAFVEESWLYSASDEDATQPVLASRKDFWWSDASSYGNPLFEPVALSNKNDSFN
jgi:hypothetical protein